MKQSNINTAHRAALNEEFERLHKAGAVKFGIDWLRMNMKMRDKVTELALDPQDLTVKVICSIGATLACEQIQYMTHPFGIPDNKDIDLDEAAQEGTLAQMEQDKNQPLIQPLS
jgi:hypothetical protein